MASEQNSKSLDHGWHLLNTILAVVAIGLAWQTSQREDRAFEREQKVFEREAEADARDKVVFELTKAAAEREKQAFAIMSASDARERLADEREEKRFLREQKAFEREENFSYVMDAGSFKDLEQPFPHCKPVTLKFTNLSKYTRSLHVTVAATGAYLHTDPDPQSKTVENVTTLLKLPGYTLAVDQSASHKFFIHSSSGNHHISIVLTVNGSQLTQYRCVWDGKEYKCYGF